MEMAPETARRCEEKREGRGLPPAERVDTAACSRFGVQEDMVFSLGYFVAKA